MSPADMLTIERTVPGPHVNSHFRTGMATMPQALAHIPRIVSRQVEGSGWDAMGELAID